MGGTGKSGILARVVKQQVKKGLNRIAPSLSVARAEIQASLAETRRLAAEIERVRELVAPLAPVAGLHSCIAQITTLLADSEPYQPIYGLPHIVSAPQRECRDRAECITESLGDVRGLRVLDLGSSFGYMAFHLADRGASAEGWDYNASNTEIARLTQAINGLSARFFTRELTPETAAALSGSQFDVVLLLSLLHHIVHFQGLDAGRQIVSTLLDRAPLLFVELAQAGEDPDLFWDRSQPPDAMAIFAGLDADVEVIGSFGTHLSDAQRPLVKVTRRSIAVGGRPYAVTGQAFVAYEGSPVRKMRIPRRYWRGDGCFIKEYHYPETDRRENERQIVNELAVLMRFEQWGSARLPVLRDYSLEKDRAVIVTDLIEGTLLDADPAAGRKFGVDILASEILATLAELEAHGLHHNDLRSWNVMLGKTVSLIDFGLCDSEARENEAVRLLWALHAVITGRREDPAQDDTTLPDRNVFTGHAFCLAVHDAVAAGETSPAALLGVSRDRAPA